MFQGFWENCFEKDFKNKYKVFTENEALEWSFYETVKCIIYEVFQKSFGRSF